MALEINRVFLCRHCLSFNCDGVPEPWRRSQVLELRFYVGLLSFQRQMGVDTNDPLVELLARFLRPPTLIDADDHWVSFFRSEFLSQAHEGLDSNA